MSDIIDWDDGWFYIYYAIISEQVCWIVRLDLSF